MTNPFESNSADAWLHQMMSLPLESNAGVGNAPLAQSFPSSQAKQVPLPSSFTSNQTKQQVLPSSVSDNSSHETNSRLMVIETMLKWIYENQIKLLEKQHNTSLRVDSLRDYMEQHGRAVRETLDQLLMSSWSHGVGSENTVSRTESTISEDDDTDRSEDESDRFTKRADLSKYL